MKVGSERSWVDTALVALGAGLALWSGGMSLGDPQLAATLGGGVLIASLLGFFVQSAFANAPKVLGLDGWLVAVAGIVSFFNLRDLNAVLPNGGFPFELIVMAGLSWTVLLGSLLAWRDGTQLFLTLPCIAIFGLVGTFDTYPLAIVFFFVFVTCVAILYARVHQRTMIARAQLAGAEDTHLLRRDVWKWMAGPEWAVASAGVVVALSVLGAPALQAGLEPISGNLSVNVPQRLNQSSGQTPNQQQASVTIGNGPVRELSETPIFAVRTDSGGYLRESVYTTYRDRGWSELPGGLVTPPAEVRPSVRSGQNGGVEPYGGAAPPGEDLGDDPRVAQVEMRAIRSNETILFTPGPTLEIDLPRGNEVRVSYEGIGVLERPLQVGETISYYAAVPPRRPSPDAVADVPEAMSSAEIQLTNSSDAPPRVQQFARNVVEGADTDFEKAFAIKRAIEQQVIYNLEAPRTPEGADPVEHFLFESREGYCDLFASSLVLMARSVGLPARYVIGYYVGDVQPEDDGFAIVRSKDYHAWAEIHFDGIGWVPFDATEGAASVDGSGRGDAYEEPIPLVQQTWFRITLIGVAVLAVAGILALLFANKGMFSLTRLLPAPAELARQHAAFQGLLERHSGSPRRYSQTLGEYVAAVGPKLGPNQSEAQEVVRTFEAAMFGPNEVGKPELESLGVALRKLRSSLNEQRKRAKG